MTVVALDAESHAFPRGALEGCTSALLLFCSGRMGAADGHWVREAGLSDVTCVDWDENTLEPFQAAYPYDWEYVRLDAWEFAGSRAAGRQWDLVTADMPSQYGALQLESLADWAPLAARFVLATVMQPALDAYDVADFIPEGWRQRDLIRRADFDGGTYWLWLERP